MAVSFDFSNKVIEVTGAASGIGLETAQLLVAASAKLSILDVQAETLNNAASALESSMVKYLRLSLM
jgi:NADP-dependent 3-hydroxy acid dehydrogenase YdfG